MRKKYYIIRNTDLAIKHFLSNDEISLPGEKFLSAPIIQNEDLANTHQEIQNIRQNL